MQKIYIVGGWCRDTVMGKSPKDRDFVLVGYTPEELETLGFTQVGKDFPVFLNPQGEEFALARTERKIGKGYNGFETAFDKSVTLEDDLLRRDLRMNSMAMEVHPKILTSGELEIIGELIDPFNGCEDITDGILRHTSEAFAEDPLRVLRTCRFAARYNFDVANETLRLMRDIVDSGEMAALPMERVYAEFERAMMEDHPRKFFDYMNYSQALDLYFEELQDWDNLGLDFAVNLNASLEERVALLVMGFNPHEAKDMLTRIKAPNHLIDAAVWSSNLEFMVNEITYNYFKGDVTAESIWEALNRFNAWKAVPKLQRIAHVHLYWGDAKVFERVRAIMEAVIAGSKVKFEDLDPSTRDKLRGKEIGEAISEKRLEVLMGLNLFPS